MIKKREKRKKSRVMKITHYVMKVTHYVDKLLEREALKVRGGRRRKIEN